MTGEYYVNLASAAGLANLLVVVRWLAAMEIRKNLMWLPGMPALLQATVTLVLGTGARLWFKVSLLAVMLRVDPTDPAIWPLKTAILCCLWHIAQIVYNLHQNVFSKKDGYTVSGIILVGLALTLPMGQHHPFTSSIYRR